MRRWLIRSLLGAAPCLGATATAVAQTYEIPAQRRAFISDNPFRLYLVQDGDTVGSRVRGISVVHERWDRDIDGFRVIRSSEDVGLARRATADTMVVTELGEVLRINGKDDYSRGEWDAFLRLPGGGLRVGMIWSDTLEHPSRGPKGDDRFRAIRRYEVAGALDTLGHAVLRIDATGVVEFRLSMWSDSTAGTYDWYDLSGPLAESFYFAPDEGELIARNWTMGLEGVGGAWDGQSTDTLPAGLESSIRRWVLDPEVADSIARPLPSGDTLVTVVGGADYLFLHTLRRSRDRWDRDRWEESLSRVDGTTGTIALTLDARGPVSADVLWTDLSGVTHRDRLRRSDDRALRSDRGPDIEIPEGLWSIADHGMLGLLVPVLETLPHGSTQEVAVYRPVADIWDVTTARVTDFDGFRVVVLTERDQSRTVLIVEDGSLLYAEKQTPSGMSQQVPSLERQPRLQEVLSVLQTGR